MNGTRITYKKRKMSFFKNPHRVECDGMSAALSETLYEKAVVDRNKYVWDVIVESFDKAERERGMRQ